MKLKLKEFFDKNKLACIFAGVTVLFELLAFILYLAAGTNKFNPNLSLAVIVAFLLCILIGGGQAVLVMTTGKTLPIVCFAQYAVALYGFGAYVITQLNLISNVMYGIMNPGSGDGNSLGAAMIITLITSLLAWIFALVAAILLFKKSKRENQANGMQQLSGEKE